MGSVANVTRASKAIEHRLAGERKLKRIQKEILANISSWYPYSLAISLAEILTNPATPLIHRLAKHSDVRS